MDFDYTDPDLQYYPIGTGNDDQVEMTNVVADGVFVATGNSSDTKLIDASASCAGSNPELQWIYATGTTNGAEVKESTDPAKLLFWAYSTWGN
jgi:hypothetical protein